MYTMVLDIHWDLDNAWEFIDARLGLCDAQLGLGSCWHRVFCKPIFGIYFMLQLNLAYLICVGGRLVAQHIFNRIDLIQLVINWADLWLSWV